MLAVTCRKCGVEFEAYPYAVKSGRKKFCGKACQDASALGVARTHGGTDTRLYTTWHGMKGRCRSTRPEARPYYLDRGITVCDEWEHSFEKFREWAMANGYTDELELDRKDNDKGYCPENCRWVTRSQQMQNTKRVRGGKSSPFKGVSWCASSSRWKVQIQADKRPRYVGLFVDEIEAAKVYDREARRLFGEFAVLNFKDGG